MSDPMNRPINMILEAARFAEEKHRGQVRKHTARPYITHPARVAGRIALLPDSSEADVCAAWLHDVREDCGVTDAELRERFGEDVADLVDGLTNRFTKEAHPEMNRRARKAAELARTAKAAPWTRRIKLADRADNLRELDPAEDFALVYLEESVDLREALRGTHEALESELDAAVADLTEKVAEARCWDRQVSDVLHAALANMKGEVRERAGSVEVLLHGWSEGEIPTPVTNLLRVNPLAVVAIAGSDVKNAAAQFAATYAGSQDIQRATRAALEIAARTWAEHLGPRGKTQ